MAILDKSHFTALYNVRQILRNIDRANPDSRHHVTRKLHLQKLRELQIVLENLIKTPMFDTLQNLDTGGPVSPHRRLDSAIYAIAGEMKHGNSDASAPH